MEQSTDSVCIMLATSSHLSSGAPTQSSPLASTRFDARPRASPPASTPFQSASAASTIEFPTRAYSDHRSDEHSDREPYVGLGKKRKRYRTTGEYEGINIQPRKKQKTKPTLEVEAPGFDWGPNFEMVDLFQEEMEISTGSNAPPTPTGHEQCGTTTYRISIQGWKTPPPSPLRGTREHPSRMITPFSPQVQTVLHGLSNSDIAPGNLQTPPPSPERYIHKPGCGHTIHPAYCDSYNEHYCPQCWWASLLKDLQDAQNKIKCHGGQRQWRESKSRDEKLFKSTAPGGSKNKLSQGICDQFGTVYSHRHCKRRLANARVILQKLAADEMVWEANFRKHHIDPKLNEVEELMIATYSNHSAKTALAEYRIAEAIGAFTVIEELDIKYVRNRGREHQITLDVDYPETPEAWDEHKVTHSYNRQTKAQPIHVHSSLVPKIAHALAHHATPSKRKRRNGKATVSFGTEVKVCFENDVDALRKEATKHTPARIDLTHDTPRSILRTTPVPNDTPILASKDSRFHGSPKRP